jgi:hypothetical protein
MKTVKQVVVPAALLLANLAFAQFRTVTVQNSDSNPVPVTGSVDIVSLPTVNLGGPIDAIITNEPTVRVDGPVAVNGTVTSTITNEPLVKVDSSSPLPVSGSVIATITNEPLVKVDSSTPLPVSGSVIATITNEPMVKVDTTSPIPVTGAVNASITNTPTVNISGNVPVTLTGTPAVSVSNLPLGVAGAQNTTVVLVKNVDPTTVLQALQPLQIPFTCTTGQNGNCTSSFNVPQGKVFVAEYMQATAQEPPAINTLYYRLQTTSGGQTMSYTYDPGAQIIGQGLKMRTSEHVMKIYADAGSTISLSGFSDLPGSGNGNQGVSLSVIVSGQLVNAQ